MNRPDLGDPTVFWREKSRHRAEIPADLVPALAALARANGIDTQGAQWETKTVETILRLIIFGGLTPQAIAAQAIGSTSRPTPPSPPPAAPIAVLSLS